MEKSAGRGKMAGTVLKALFVSYAVTAVILSVSAFLLLEFQMDTQKTGIMILACYVISCFFGGLLCGRRAGKRKFLWGLLTGILYFALLLLFSGMSESVFPPDIARILTTFVLCAGSGMAGGMIS